MKREKALLVKNQMANFVIENFDETPSGSVRPRFAVKRSFLNGYQKFVAAGGNGSYNTWLDVTAQLHVRVAKNEERDEFSCPHCKTWKAQWELQLRPLQNKEPLSLSEKRKKQELEENLSLLKYHQQLAAVMRAGDRKLLEDLVPGQMLAHGDFTTFNPVDEEGFLGVYVLVFRWRERIGGEVFSAVLYCTAAGDIDAPKDKDFVHSTFRALHSAGFFDDTRELMHFSDTGTAHFRNSNSLYLFSLFQRDTGIKVRICVYAACHGHNSCDSNAGVAKKIVRYQAQGLEKEGGLWDRTFLRQCMQSQRGAAALEIPIEELPKLVAPIDSITQFHDFTFDNDEIICRKWFGAEAEEAIKRVTWRLL